MCASTIAPLLPRFANEPQKPTPCSPIKTPLPQDIIQNAPRLKFIFVLATGYNIVDIAAVKQRCIVVSNVPDYGTNTTDLRCPASTVLGN